MKTTQDMHIWLNQLAALLGKELISIEQFSDKTFRISAHNGGETSEILYDSDDAMEVIDINDLPYHTVEEFSKIITARQEIANINTSDL